MTKKSEKTHTENNSTLNFDEWNKKDIELLAIERATINQIDKEILALLDKRAQASLAIGDLKKKSSKTPKIYDAKREEELLERLYSINKENSGFLENKHIESIWREIMSSSRALQKSFTLSFLGPEGTFSYFAGKEFFGENVSLKACSDFQEIFEDVVHGKCEGGIVPLENSLYGTVGTCFDLFAKNDVSIEAEFYSRISLNLISKEQNFLNIKKVYSHAQPLGQASLWLRANLPHAELVSVESTSFAASLAHNEEYSAVIGHAKLADAYAMNILASSIENDKKNWTRFVLLQRKTRKRKKQILKNRN